MGRRSSGPPSIRAHAAGDDRLIRLDGRAAVGGVGHRTQFERPVAVRGDVEELLGLGVADGEQDRERLVGARGELALDVAGARSLEHEQVAEDDARHALALRAFRLQRADEVDVVARLQRAHQQLVLAARELQRAQPALELGVDALLSEWLEPVERDLLALVDLLGCDQLLDLVRLRDRTGHDVAPGDLHRLQQVAVADLVARRADGDLARGDVHRYELFARLHAVLVVRDVEDRQQRGQYGERNRDPDISDSVTHRGGFSPSLYSGLFDEFDCPRTETRAAARRAREADPIHRHEVAVDPRVLRPMDLVARHVEDGEADDVVPKARS